MKIALQALLIASLMPPRRGEFPARSLASLLGNLTATSRAELRLLRSSLFVLGDVSGPGNEPMACIARSALRFSRCATDARNTTQHMYTQSVKKPIAERMSALPISSPELFPRRRCQLASKVMVRGQDAAAGAQSARATRASCETAQGQ
jgi:hypothetical protein